MGILPTVTVVTVMVLGSLSLVDSQCDKTTGPGGNYMCIPVEGYDKDQWGTCLTNEYLRRKSRGTHNCIETSSTYCWYQCMIEVHDQENGTVKPDCVCNSSSQPTSPPTQSNVILNHTCYSPPGNVCSWYRDCLEKKFPCRDSSDHYIVAYHERLCNLYGKKQNYLSGQGAHWLDAVRRCLQVELVPLLRPFESGQVTCSSIRTSALKHHASCYTNPYLGVPSICQLSASDFWTIFWGMRGEFTAIFVQSLFGMIQVAKSCGNPDLLRLMGAMRKMTLRLDISSLDRSRRAALFGSPLLQKEIGYLDRDIMRRERREITFDSTSQAGAAMINPEAGGARVARQISSNTWTGESAENLEYHRLAALATSSLELQLDWGKKEVISFAYGELIERHFMDVHILLADRHAYNLQKDLYSPRPNMTQAVQNAAKLIQTKGADMTLDGQSTPVTTLRACYDIDCRTPYSETTAAPPTGVASRSSGSWMTLIFCAGRILVHKTDF